MEINVDNVDGVCVVSPYGHLDAASSSDFGYQTKELIEDNQILMVVDMSNIEYISSAGLREILGLAKGIRAADGKLIFCSLQAMVEEVFQISDFLSILDVCTTLDEALNQIKQQEQ